MIDDGSYNMNPTDRSLDPEKKCRPSISSARSVKVVDRLITARNQGDSKVNDVTVNDNILGMIVQPCNIYTNDCDCDCDCDDKNDELITWEVMKIDRERDRSYAANAVENIFTEEVSSSNKPRRPPGDSYFQSDDKSFDGDKKDRGIPLVDDLSIQEDDNARIENDRDNIITWSSSVQKLNQTYLIKDSEDREIRADRNILNDSNPRLDDTRDLTIIGTISARVNHYEINPENVNINGEKMIDHRLSTSNCNLTEDNSEIYEIKKKWDTVEENIDNEDRSKGAFYTDAIIENKMIEGRISSSFSSEIERIINETKDSSENMNMNEKVAKLLVNDENKIEENNSMFAELTDKRDSRNSRVSVSRTNAESDELHNVREICPNEQFKYSTEEEDDDDDDDDDDHDKENEEEDIDDKRSTISDREDRENDPRRSSTINSKPPIGSIKINSKIQKNMNLLRGSTDTLISSIEAIDYANNKRSKRINSIFKEDDADLSSRIANHYEKCDKLPEIKRYVKTTNSGYDLGEHCYWKKTMKFSNDRSVNDLMSYNYRQNRLLKRNPKIRILPPVLVGSSSPRIQR